jgi:mRNA interferase YafQ
MLRLLETTRFQKDLKRMKRRGKSFERYKEIEVRLVREEALPYSFREHRLRGQWADFWEGHIEPDWLLVYHRTETAIILVRTGSHADLFE